MTCILLLICVRMWLRGREKEYMYAYKHTPTHTSTSTRRHSAAPTNNSKKRVPPKP